jgi:hypothetical protein
MNQIHRSSSGCHVAHGDVAPETIVRNTIGDSQNMVLLLLPVGARNSTVGGSSPFMWGVVAVDGGRPGHRASAWHGRPASLPCAGVASSWHVFVVAFRCHSLGVVGDCGSGEEGWRRR